MNVQTKPSLGAAQRLIPFERVALVLQGGGALGAYQAGVYEALAESPYRTELDCRHFDWRHQRGYHRRQSAEHEG